MAQAGKRLTIDKRRCCPVRPGWHAPPPVVVEVCVKHADRPYGPPMAGSGLQESWATFRNIQASAVLACGRGPYPVLSGRVFRPARLMLRDGGSLQLQPERPAAGGVGIAVVLKCRDVVRGTDPAGDRQTFVRLHVPADVSLPPDEFAWRRSCNAGWHEQAQRQPGSLQGGRPRAAGRRYPPGAQQAEARTERRSGAVRDAAGGSHRDVAGRPVHISERAVRRERAAGEPFEWRDAPRAWRRGRVESPCCSASA